MLQLDKNQCFYHGFRSFDRLEKVLKNGAILAKIHMELDPCYLYNPILEDTIPFENTIGIDGGYCGKDFISIVRREDPSIFTSGQLCAYDEYIKNSMCYIISPDVPAIKTMFDDTFSNSNSELPSDLVRYSCYFDEWQVKDAILLSSVLAIGLSSSFGYPPYLLEQYHQIVDLLQKYHYDIPVVDTETFMPFSESTITLQKKRR